MSASRRREPSHPESPAAPHPVASPPPGPPPDAGERPSWFQPAVPSSDDAGRRPSSAGGPALGGGSATAGGPSPAQPQSSAAPATGWPPPAPMLLPGQAAPSYGTQPPASPLFSPAVPAAAPQDPGAAAPGSADGATGAAQPDDEATAEAQERRKSNRRRPMSRGRRIALQLVGGLVLTAGLVGAKSYDAFHRFEMTEPPPSVRTIPVGETIALENARWRLVNIGPMPDPPADPGEGRAWLQMKLQVTPLNKEGTKYRFSTPALDLADDAGHTWRVEVLRLPSKDMVPGQPTDFDLIAVAPVPLADQVELVLWPGGRSGTGPAVRFDR